MSEMLEHLETTLEGDAAWSDAARARAASAEAALIARARELAST